MNIYCLKPYLETSEITVSGQVVIGHPVKILVYGPLVLLFWVNHWTNPISGAHHTFVQFFPNSVSDPFA